MTKDVRTFSLQARGESRAAKTQLLKAFADLARHFGMSTRLSQHDHRLIIRSTKVQRVALFIFNRKRARKAQSK